MNNEITVKLNCSIDEICKILESKKFKVSNKFILDDTYFIPEKIELKDKNYRDILKKAIILRRIILFNPECTIVKLTKKFKDIDNQKENLKILVKDVENSDKLIEVETQNNIELNTIDKIKQKIEELNLPIDTKDYFVKKAEIELSKIL